MNTSTMTYDKETGCYTIKCKGKVGTIEQSGGGGWYIDSQDGELSDIVETRAAAIKTFEKYAS